MQSVVTIILYMYPQQAFAHPDVTTVTTTNYCIMEGWSEQSTTSTIHHPQHPPLQQTHHLARLRLSYAVPRLTVSGQRHSHNGGQLEEGVQAIQLNDVLSLCEHWTPLSQVLQVYQN